MTSTLLSFPKFRAFTQSGTLLPLAGGKLYSYLAGTSTPQATYTDSTGTVPNANPVILDAAGMADVWLGGVSYKLTLTDALGNIQWVEDNITSGVGGWEVGLAAAQAQLAAIADSGTLSNDKKPDVIMRYNQAVSDYSQITAKAIATQTPYTSYATAFSALQTYILGLSPAYNDLVNNTTIVAATWQATWASFYTENTAMLIKLVGAAPSAVTLVSTTNLNLLTNAAAPTIDSVVSAAGNVILATGQTAKSENGIYTTVYTPSAGAPYNIFPTAGSASNTGDIGTYTSDGNAFDNVTGTPTDATYATLTAGSPNASTETVVYAGFTGSNLTGTLHVKVTPMCVIDGGDFGNASPTVSYSTDNGATYSTSTVYDYGQFSSMQDFTAALSGALGSSIRVKVTTNSYKPQVENPNPPPIRINGTPAVGIARINSVYLAIPASGADNYKFVKTTNVADGTIFRPTSGTVYGGKVYAAAVATDNTITLTQSSYDTGNYDIWFSKSGKPLAGEKVLIFSAPRPFTVQAQGHSGKCYVNPTATASFVCAKNGTTFGTLQFSTGGVLSLVAFASTNFVVNDILTVTAPGSQDATLSDVGCVLRGNV